MPKSGSKKGSKNVCYLHHSPERPEFSCFWPLFDHFLINFWVLQIFHFFRNKYCKMSTNLTLFRSFLDPFLSLSLRSYPMIVLKLGVSKLGTQKWSKSGQKVHYLDHFGNFLVRTLKSWILDRYQNYQVSPFKTQNVKNGFSGNPPRASNFPINHDSQLQIL